MRRLLLYLLLITTISACEADASARVIGISNGDSIVILTADKTQHRIRLWGIDAPETGQEFGSRAKQTASGLAFGKTVKILPRDKDRYGRTVAEVILPDGRSMNREMVRQGMAWWYRQFAPHDAELAGLEAAAKAAPRTMGPAESGPALGLPAWGGLPQTAGVVGNRRSWLFHMPSCRGAAIMSKQNRVEFGNAAEAEKAGYPGAGLPLTGILRNDGFDRRPQVPLGKPVAQTSPASRGRRDGEHDDQG